MGFSIFGARKWVREGNLLGGLCPALRALRLALL